jgi:hypothetical protein
MTNTKLTLDQLQTINGGRVISGNAGPGGSTFMTAKLGGKSGPGGTTFMTGSIGCQTMPPDNIGSTAGPGGSSY